MENSRYKLLMLIGIFVVLISLSNLAMAETTCSTAGCEIKITIKIAFSGGDNTTINNWVNDIETVWNGYTLGDCKCPLKVEVEWKSISGLCENNPTPGYHCIDVTADYAKDASGKIYRGYMRGIAASGVGDISGWWSNHMNEALPGVQGTIHDAAHEAGHMMGLGDEYNASSGTYGENIMGRTWSDKAKPTQAQINAIATKICGSNACPKPKCCCGNAKIDEGEECDHKLEPCGCEEGAICVSCKCFMISPPVCGDGKVNGEEECDYMSTNNTCASDETCSSDCVCEAEEEEPSDFSIEITDPDDGEEIGEDGVDVKATVTGNESAITEVRFYIDGDHQFTDEDYPWKWDFNNPEDFDEGEHTIMARAYDEDSNTVEDEIDIEIVL